MQKPSCNICKRYLHYYEKRAIIDGKEVCTSCYDMSREIGEKLEQAFNSIPAGKIENTVNKYVEKYNEPSHYHQHEIDTIEFLQRGFPPQVFMGFAIGHVIKYAQRAEYKNGREDFVKMVDYAKRALDWYDKTHS